MFALPLAWPDITDINDHHSRRLLPSAPLYPHANGGVPHGHSIKTSPMEPRAWLPCWLEELLILNRPCRPGEDVHDSVLPTSHWQAWKTWEHTKKEIEAKATKAGVIWFVDEDAVQHILEIISISALN